VKLADATSHLGREQGPGFAIDQPLLKDLGDRRHILCPEGADHDGAERLTPNR
jgi:hypothetical protein